jgi:hypothetical protein
MDKLTFTDLTSLCRSLIPFLFALFVISCESQSPLDEVPAEQRNVSALVIFDGSPAVDGCGWLIHHDQNFHTPVNLDSLFMIDSLKVILSYNILESTWNCGWRQLGYREIEIVEIEKQ